nr:hypothetical protein [Xanthomonas citri]
MNRSLLATTIASCLVLTACGGGGVVGVGAITVVCGASLRTLPPPPPPQAVRTRQEAMVVASSERFIGLSIPVIECATTAGNSNLAQKVPAPAIASEGINFTHYSFLDRRAFRSYGMRSRSIG